MPEFEQIFQSHHKAVYFYLRRLLSKNEDVEDCLQETFIRFWKSFSRYDDQGRMRAYLLKIARNLAIDHMRRQKTMLEHTRSIHDIEAVAGPKGCDEQSEKSELANLLREKVGRLPFSQRETFILFRYQGLSYQEIAEIQGVSVKTVDSRLYRAMKWLTEHLAGHPRGKSEDLR